MTETREVCNMDDRFGSLYSLAVFGMENIDKIGSLNSLKCVFSFESEEGEDCVTLKLTVIEYERRRVMLFHNPKMSANILMIEMWDGEKKLILPVLEEKPGDEVENFLNEMDSILKILTGWKARLIHADCLRRNIKEVQMGKGGNIKSPRDIVRRMVNRRITKLNLEGKEEV